MEKKKNYATFYFYSNYHIPITIRIGKWSKPIAERCIEIIKKRLGKKPTHVRFSTKEGSIYNQTWYETPLYPIDSIPENPSIDDWVVTRADGNLLKLGESIEVLTKGLWLGNFCLYKKQIYERKSIHED
ncbi:MAG: hypothetical protein QXU40_01465 [Candidatus Pacearchaeota archaeon]